MIGKVIRNPTNYRSSTFLCFHKGCRNTVVIAAEKTVSSLRRFYFLGLWLLLASIRMLIVARFYFGLRAIIRAVVITSLLMIVITIIWTMFIADISMIVVAIIPTVSVTAIQILSSTCRTGLACGCGKAEGERSYHQHFCQDLQFHFLVSSSVF